MGKYTVSEARRLRGYSQRYAAKYLGLSLNGYRKKERGTSRFYVDQATRFCEMVDLSMNDIYFDQIGAETCNDTKSCPDIS